MNDTIAAIATAYGEGGIGIIRISGENALTILKKLFVPCKDKPIVARTMTYGHIVNPKTAETVDEVLVVYFKEPYTYTTEDVAEIHCHGSVVALNKTLSLVLGTGARLAEPGEFTKRAFLNGRLDLSQAEAVIDVVKAKTQKSFHVALEQLEGNLSRVVRDIRRDLLELLAQITVNIDYPDEDMEELTYNQLETEILKLNKKIDVLKATTETGKIVHDGLDVVIVGRPNVGKSSLMNKMLRENRAIVTETPGTTRDTIEEGINIKGIPIRLTDTAGIHQTKNVIEQLGIEKSKASFNRADLILLVLDASQKITEEDKKIISTIGERKVFALLNKIDLPQKLEAKNIETLLPKGKSIKTSMQTGEGLTQIEEEIERMVYGGEVRQQDSLLITNARHKSLLEKAREATGEALATTKRQEALDFIEIDLKCGYDFLGEIIGETIGDDILDQVFAHFCLGK